MIESVLRVSEFEIQFLVERRAGRVCVRDKTESSELIDCCSCWLASFLSVLKPWADLTREPRPTPSADHAQRCQKHV